MVLYLVQLREVMQTELLTEVQNGSICRDVEGPALEKSQHGATIYVVLNLDLTVHHVLHMMDKMFQ